MPDVEESAKDADIEQEDRNFSKTGSDGPAQFGREVCLSLSNIEYRDCFTPYLRLVRQL